jgi:MerR family transcriptional regulator, thiopeptide resistance regulator
VRGSGALDPDATSYLTIVPMRKRAAMTDATKVYRVREFARLAGVTVRALHHYDRVGLLKPRRTRAGHRIYVPDDLGVLEQIVALKFIGIPLRNIGALVRKGANELPDVLAAQRLVLEGKRRLLDRAINAIGDAEAAFARGGVDSADVLKRIIEVIEMQHDDEEWKSQYNALVQGKIERLKAMTPEMKTALQQDWNVLFDDVKMALSAEPSSATAQALATRWLKLLETFSGAIEPGMAKKFGATYQGSAPPFGDARVWEFMGKVLAARP